jgi:hypothetical protein
MTAIPSAMAPDKESFQQAMPGRIHADRSRIACKYCKQRELGCPAEQFFGNQRA